MSSITDYASLQEVATRWAGYGDGIPVPSRITSAVIDSIALAEQDINDLLRVPEMIARSLFTAESEFISCPTNLAKLITVGRIVDSAETALKPVGEADLVLYATGYRGTPAWFALVGMQLRFAPAPTTDEPLTGRITYYGNVDALSTAAPCTATLQRYPNVYLYGTLKHLAHYTEDDAKQAKWADLQAKEIIKANRANMLRDASL